jgi:hypothetical protein
VPCNRAAEVADTDDGSSHGAMLAPLGVNRIPEIRSP